MTAAHQEKPLQRQIAEHLEQHGWLHSPSSAGYDKVRALFPEDLLGWLDDTDPENYAKIVPPAADPTTRAKGEKRILDRVVRQLETAEAQGGGTLNTLRKGFHLPGAKKFSLLQMPPADSRNPNLTARYGQNRLRVVQEVVYSTKKADRIDLVFFLNGLPVATVELKTHYTQTLQDAITQYKVDRTPQGEPLLTAGRGALVHFAATEADVVMTTKLTGAETFFLPFNQGHQNGAGNPPNPAGYATAYFWEQVLDRDTWLTILSKFVYTNHEKQTDPLTGKVTEKTQIRFPRYHQWRAVTKLTAAARDDGPGNKYLIQHSAGSGKTDSIAWTAHRLSTLHTPAGHKVFDTVIVIADRQVLDRQLQDAVDQLVTATGTFQPITAGSEGSKTTQLLEALTTGVPIIGVTLQTFPYALEKIRDEGGALAGKHFAVIADEAHSSQAGDAASALKNLLYLNNDAVPASAASTGTGGAGSVEEVELEPGADQDALNTMAARADDDGRISYFAFTATPKAKTLELFGSEGPDGKPAPFDLYPMKQAIEEGFILDVLKNYTTYDVAARIALKGTGQEPDTGAEGEGPTSGMGSGGKPTTKVDVRRGTKAYIGFVELHPTNVSSKADVIIEHFQNTVQPELGGRAKAMVVTGSRVAAVRYQRAFEKAIEQRKLDLKTLVAFSGEVPDPDVTPLPGHEPNTVTEASINPDLKGRDLAVVFNQADQHVLIVANKYQTGFDQPLLVGMYVDKSLSGIAAVQTLSRLNRRAPGKKDTYVLDFVNAPDTILAAFQDYYEDAELQTASDPDLVADLMNRLDHEDVYTESELEQVWKAWVAVRGNKAERSRLDAGLNPAVDRFSVRWKQAAVESEDAARDHLYDFYTVLGQYEKSYSFMSQILNFGDPRFEKLAVFADLLARRLRGVVAGDDAGGLVTADDVVLTHYRLEKLKDEDLQLADGEGRGLDGMTEAGMTRQLEKDRAVKSELIAKVNEYFGDLEASPEFLVDAGNHLVENMLRDDTLRTQARNNSAVDFRHSPTLVQVAEDAIWQHESSTDEVLKAFRGLPGPKLVDFLMALGLHERLNQERSVG
ncbi:type I restriction endonuclease [Citricoccus nitrophenolicus]|uniref:Type I restriction endonuclease n=1 Tax=Citricoccus nitrophenolicus TaxID=863575 RepID=A0ABV0IIN5_9MICC